MTQSIQPEPSFDLTVFIARLFTNPKTRIPAILIMAILGGAVMYMWGPP